MNRITAMFAHCGYGEKHLDDLFTRADELDDDPLHGMLVALKLFAETMAKMEVAHPGCLAASFCYQEQLFDREVRDLNAAGVLAWRKRFRARFALIAERYPPRRPVDIDALADMAASTVEGGLMLGKMLHDPRILPAQILLFRELVKATFAPD